MKSFSAWWWSNEQEKALKQQEEDDLKKAKEALLENSGPFDVLIGFDSDATNTVIP